MTRHRRPLVLTVALALGGAGLLGAQSTDSYPDDYELSVFGGGSFFKTNNNGLGTKHVRGGATGLRVTENFWNRFGLEQSYTYSTNNLAFKQPGTPGQPIPAFGSRIHAWAFNPVMYFTDKGSRWRPFVTLGLGTAQFDPTDESMEKARSLAYAPYRAQSLNDNLQVQFNYGGGIKYFLTRNLGVRFDVRGLMSAMPTYVLPSFPTGGAYIPSEGRLHGLQTTVGVVYAWGGDRSAPAPRPRAAAPAPAPAPVAPAEPKAEPLGDLRFAGVRVTDGFYRPQGRTADGILCMDRAVTLTAEATDPAGKALRYKWTRDGQVVQDNDRNTYTFTPSAKGDTKFDVEAYDATTNRKASGGITLSIYEYKRPTISAIGGPATANFGDVVNLSATGTGSECSTISYRWTASEGSVAGSGTSVSYDTKQSGITPSGRVQTRPVRIVAQVSDDRGASADATKELRVGYTPQAVRYSDIIFSKGSARVNNCGKRILLEEVAAKANDADYQIVLVGHIDEDERRMTGLDRRRVMNAAAVLTGGTGTCARVDPSRVKADWVATDQTSVKQPGLCGTSARQASDERRGSAVSDADSSRRVEVWLVPVGSGAPTSVKSLKDLNPAEVKRLGCPQ